MVGQEQVVGPLVLDHLGVDRAGFTVLTRISPAPARCQRLHQPDNAVLGRDVVPGVRLPLEPAPEW